MANFSKEELQYVASQIRPYLLELVKSNGLDVDNIEVADYADGITSLPAFDNRGGVKKVVRVPLSTLAKPAIDAAEGLQDSIDSANAAAATANDAADNADAAAANANAAAADVDRAKTEAELAADNANTAAASVNAAAESAVKAAKQADAATKDTQEATADAKTAADNANKAADNANKAADECREVIDEAQQTDSLNLVPVSMELEYPKEITYGNLAELFVKANLNPASVKPNVLFLGDNHSVSVTPDGRLTALQAGTSTIHVIPTANTAIYKSIQIKVINPTLRMVNTRTQLLLTGNGELILN